MFADFKKFHIQNYDMAGLGGLTMSVKCVIISLYSVGNDVFEMRGSRKCVTSGVFISLLALHFFCLLINFYYLCRLKSPSSESIL